MSAAFLAGVVAGYGVALPMGAIAVLIAGLSARTSLRVGAAAGLGAATADGVFAAIAVAGGAAVAAAVAPVAGPLRWVAAVVLLVLAGVTARAAVRGPRRSEAPPEPDLPRAPDVTGRPAASRRCKPPGDDRGSGSPREAGTGGVPGLPEGGLGGARGGASSEAGFGRGPVTPARAYAGVLGLTLLNPATVVYFAALVLGRGGEGGGVPFVAGVVLASASWQLAIAAGGALVGRRLTSDRGRLISALVASAVIAVLAVRLLT